MTFSRDELLQAIELAAASREPEETPNSITRPEFQELTGMSEAAAQRALKEAVKAGVLSAESIWRRQMHGYVRRVMGYVLVERPDPS